MDKFHNVNANPIEYTRTRKPPALRALNRLGGGANNRNHGLQSPVISITQQLAAGYSAHYAQIAISSDLS